MRDGVNRVPLPPPSSVSAVVPAGVSSCEIRPVDIDFPAPFSWVTGVVDDAAHNGHGQRGEEVRHDGHHGDDNVEIVSLDDSYTPAAIYQGGAP